MKLVRFGNVGEERPGLIDGNGQLRDLSAHIGDVSGPSLSDEVLQSIRELDIDKLPKVDGEPRLGACVGNIGKFLLGFTELHNLQP